MISAFISAIFNAIGVTFDKLIVSSKYMSGLSMIKLRLFYISILMIIPIVFFGSLQPDFFTPKYILIFVALVINDLVLNLLFYSVLRKKKLSEIEPITLLATPMTMFFAMLIFSSERSPSILIISIIATLALLISRFERKHLNFDKYSWLLIGFCITSAIEVILMKYLLGVSNAISIYGLRTVCIVIILFLFFRKIKINKIKPKEKSKIFLNSIFGSIELVTRLYAISMIGIVNSSIIFLLGPIFVLLFSKIYLKEKITVRRGIGDAVIIACVFAVILIS